MAASDASQIGIGISNTMGKLIGHLHFPFSTDVYSATPANLLTTLVTYYGMQMITQRKHLNHFLILPPAGQKLLNLSSLPTD